jgi:hypothetical protein
MQRFTAHNGRTHPGAYTLAADKKTFASMPQRTIRHQDGRGARGPPPRPLDELKVQVQDSAVYVVRDFRLGAPSE